MRVSLTIPLNELRATDIPVAGGKAASLGELICAGVSVPPGFVVTDQAFDLFMNGVHKSQIDRIKQQLLNKELSIEYAESQIASLLKTVPLPPDVVTAVEQAVLDLGVEKVAVRSSATCEDSSVTTWAGQLDTYLNIGAADVVTCLRNCWLSMFSRSALAYGASHSEGSTEFSVAVVIQEMIASEISGIGFSVHPVTQEPNVMLIEACFGLGEAIVSGRIKPDQYIIQSDTKVIIEELIGKQQRGLYINPAENTMIWRTLGDSGASRKLSQSQVLEYARLLERIENHYDYPVDTEWAFKDGSFQILQARPITTLAEEYEQQLIPCPNEWQKVVRRPMSLLEVSIFSHWLDSEHATKMGVVESRVLSIQDDADMAINFWSASDMAAAGAHIHELYQKERDQLIAMLQYGQTIYQDARQLIKRGKSAFEDIDAAVNYFINAAQFTTSLPAMTLKYYQQQKLDDPEIRTLAEKLRADTLYPHIERQIVDPMVTQMLTEIGFSEPEAAPLVTTWSELRQGDIDCELLETRLRAVLAGKRFIFQSINGVDSVRFVSQSGYLLMRLAQQRQVISDIEANPTLLSGQSAWPGQYCGRARVILSPDAVGQTLEEGEILISIQSSPALMPLLQRCSALVTDDGGIACHAAIIARELRIPTLIGTGRATSAIRTGDYIEVDTYNKVVRILERAETMKLSELGSHN